MFVKVFYTFCKVIVLTCLLVVAFSLSFYMAFYNPKKIFARSPFYIPGRSLVKTMTMIAGEFEYESIFNFPSLPQSRKFEDLIPEEVPNLEMATILWILFLILAPILYLNLLVRA